MLLTQGQHDPGGRRRAALSRSPVCRRCSLNTWQKREHVVGNDNNSSSSSSSSSSDASKRRATRKRKKKGGENTTAKYCSEHRRCARALRCSQLRLFPARSVFDQSSAILSTQGHSKHERHYFNTLDQPETYVPSRSFGSVFRFGCAALLGQQIWL